MKSGVYNYFLNCEPTGVTETFDIQILPNGSKLITSIRDAKPFNTTITVITDDKFKNCKITYQKDENKIEAIYKFAEKTFCIKRKFNNEVIQNETFNLPSNYVFFPLMRCVQGQTILQVVANNNFTTVIVPDIQVSTDVKDLLKPTFDERTAEWIGSGTIKLSDKLADVKIYKYLSKHYDENSEFWIIPNGFLYSYTFTQSDQQIWKAYLKTT